MRAHGIILGLATAIGGLAASNAALAEQYRGTWEQQMACTPDVWRLCSSQIPDVERITACLRQNTPQLSEGCRAVFESNDSMRQSQPAPPPRGYAAPPAHGRTPPPRTYYDDDD